jgi:chromosome partitioning related protein ParA
MQDRRARVVTVASTKGGVGKTTLVANLGGLLAALGQRTLLIDADVQPTLSGYYALTAQANAGLTQLIQTGRLDGCVSRTAVGCDLVYSDDPEGRLQNWLLHTADGRFRLHRALRGDLPYDIVLIDTQGAVGPLQDAAVLAADRLLSPIPPEMLSAREFGRGTLEMLDRVDQFGYLGIRVGPLHAVVYRMDRTVDARRIADQLRDGLAPLQTRNVHLTAVTVPAAVAFREAATAREPVHLFSPKHGQILLDLARELLPELSLPTQLPPSPSGHPVAEGQP